MVEHDIMTLPREDRRLRSALAMTLMRGRCRSHRDCEWNIVQASTFRLLTTVQSARRRSTVQWTQKHVQNSTERTHPLCSMACSALLATGLFLADILVHLFPHGSRSRSASRHDQKVGHSVSQLKSLGLLTI